MEETLKTAAPGKKRVKKAGSDGSRQRKETQEILQCATPDAARFLASMLLNEDAAMNHRLDAAKEVLNRAYGKTPPADSGEGGQTVRIILEGDVKDFAG